MIREEMMKYAITKVRFQKALQYIAITGKPILLVPPHLEEDDYFSKMYYNQELKKFYSHCPDTYHSDILWYEVEEAYERICYFVHYHFNKLDTDLTLTKEQKLIYNDLWKLFSSQKTHITCDYM